MLGGVELVVGVWVVVLIGIAVVVGLVCSDSENGSGRSGRGASRGGCGSGIRHRCGGVVVVEGWGGD